MSNRSKFIVTGIVILFILTGFFREFVFLNINEQMRVTYYHSPDPHVAPSMQWLSAFDYATLYYLKWPLTLAFAAVFATYAALTVRLMFRDKLYVRVTWLAYAGVFTLSFVFFGIGLLSGSREATYDIARFLAGIIETPAMLVVLVSSFLIMRRS